MKTAFITGINGQDGAYLAKLLLGKGYRVIGGDRRRSTYEESSRLSILGIKEDIELVSFDLLDLSNIYSVISSVKPDEFYNLAAQSFVQASFTQPILTAEVDALAVVKILEALRQYVPNCKFYQASTSEMFGLVQEVPQSETTPFYPRSPYGVAKLYAHWIVKNYRESYGMFACSGILFNHESELRGMDFVTKKVVYQAVRIVKGIDTVLELGNLDAERDWGHAEDYVYGMYLMLQAEKADDYVLATGKTTTIRKFVEKVFKKLEIELEWKGKGINEVGICKKSNAELVRVNPAFYRPSEVDLLLGDSTKALKDLKWAPKINLDMMITRMIDFEKMRYVD